MQVNVKVMSSNVGKIYVPYCYLLVTFLFAYIILEIDNYKLL